MAARYGTCEMLEYLLTLWFVYHTSPREFASRDYTAVIDALIAAGAKTDVYPEMEQHIEGVYRLAGKKRRAHS